MRQLQFLTVALGALLANGFLVPAEIRSTSLQLSDTLKRSIPYISDLEKRKGGGGGRGGGSSSSGSSSSGSSSGSSSSGSRGGTSSSSSGSRTSTSSNTGGRTVAGSGPRPIYGGGRYYGGGAAYPYTAGARTPKGLLALGLLPLAGLAFLGAAWASSYPYGAYHYNYNQPWAYYNATSGRNETTPVTCLCGRYNSCGCDDNVEADYIRSVVNNGSLASMNSTLINVANANGTGQRTIYLNGEVPNGTTAAGGTDSGAGTMTTFLSGTASPKRIALVYGLIFLFVGSLFSTI